MKTPTSCKHCEGKSLTWHTFIANRSNSQQGRLNTNDVECVFVLGCDDCSETLVVVGADKVAQQLGKMSKLLQDVYCAKDNVSRYEADIAIADYLDSAK